MHLNRISPASLNLTEVDRPARHVAELPRVHAGRAGDEADAQVDQGVSRLGFKRLPQAEQGRGDRGALRHEQDALPRLLAKRTARLQQTPVWRVLHREKGRAVLRLPHLVNRNDVGMRQCAGGTGFAQESTAHFGVDGEMRRQCFDRHWAFELFVDADALRERLLSGPAHTD